MSPLPFAIFVPVKTPSLTNVRVHWRTKAKRAADHRAMVTMAWAIAGRPHVTLPAEVILTRVSPRPLDDDNLRGALKSVRDGIASELGIDDRDPLVTWRYDQLRGKPKQHGVRVTIGELPAVCPTCGRKNGVAA